MHCMPETHKTNPWGVEVLTKYYNYTVLLKENPPTAQKAFS